GCRIDERVRATGERAREELPRQQAGEQKNRVRNAITSDSGDVREHEGQDEHEDDRLDHRPSDTEEGLLVLTLDFPEGEVDDQFAVARKFSNLCEHGMFESEKRE